MLVLHMSHGTTTAQNKTNFCINARDNRWETYIHDAWAFRGTTGLLQCAIQNNDPELRCQLEEERFTERSGNQKKTTRIIAPKPTSPNHKQGNLKEA